MTLVPAHGGELRPLLAEPSRAAALKEEALALPSWNLTDRQVRDVELLLGGAFSPLAGFLGEADYERVCGEMRLASGTLWPIPIALDVTESFAEKTAPGTRLALRHPEGMLLALMTVTDRWTPDRGSEAERIFGTTDEEHPGVFRLVHRTNPVYLGGPLEGVEPPQHHTFRHLRHTAGRMRARLEELGWKRVLACGTSEPMHRAEVEMTQRAAESSRAKILLQPLLDHTDPGDADYFARVRCYQEVLRRFPEDSAELSLLPLAPCPAGARAALWRAIVRKNYGCSHVLAAEGSDAEALVRKHADELGLTVVPFEKTETAERTADEARQHLEEGLDVPDSFTYPEVIESLRRARPPRAKQGFTVFFTGLSGAGKSTIAKTLVAKLMEAGTRPVTLLDGDIVRKNISSELGFSRKHRDLNILRIGFVASEITKNRGAAVCAPIAPYRAVRRRVRETIARYGGFVEIYVSTPLEVCEKRDRKGLYAKARAGLIKGFTGIDDPYEAPEDAELAIDTSSVSPEEAAGRILRHLEDAGFLAPAP